MISERMLEFYNNNPPDDQQIKGDSSYLDNMDWTGVKTVLDIGSGGGFDCKILAEKVPRVIGIDVQEKMITYAKENNGAPNIEYIKVDVETYLFEENYFDAIISNWALFHIRDKKPLLKKIRNALKYGGTFLFQDGTHYGYERTDLYYENAKSYHALLTEVGFSNLTYYGEKPKAGNGGLYVVTFKVNK